MEYSFKNTSNPSGGHMKACQLRYDLKCICKPSHYHIFEGKNSWEMKVDPFPIRSRLYNRLSNPLNRGGFRSSEFRKQEKFLAFYVDMQEIIYSRELLKPIMCRIFMMKKLNFLKFKSISLFVCFLTTHLLKRS